MTSLSSRALPESSFAKASGGGHDWDRTSDPHDVDVVLFR